MAYCRFTSSDIYLYYHVDNYVCCCCCGLRPKNQKTIWTAGCEPGVHPMFPDGIEGCKECEGEGCEECCMHPDAKFEHYHDAIQHVKEHIAALDHVPDHVIPALERDYRIDKWKPTSVSLRRKHRRALFLLSKTTRGMIPVKGDRRKVVCITETPRFSICSHWYLSNYYCTYPYPKQVIFNMPVRGTKKPFARRFKHFRRKRHGR